MRARQGRHSGRHANTKASAPRETTRRNFCNIVNSIWDLGIWCEPAQNIMGIDMDGDGAIYDDDSDGANTGVETDNGGESNE